MGNLRHLLAGSILAVGLAVGASGAASAQQALRIAVAAADTTGLDPHRASAVQDKVTVSWIFNGLMRFKPGSADPLKLEPDLAESYTSSPDGLTWTFKLRPGVSFHGGYGELTADDVVYSIQRAADPKRSGFAGDFAEMESVTAKGPLEVELKLKRPIPSVLGLVSNLHGGNVVSKKAAEELGEGFRLKPVGTGPFAFADYKAQQSLTLTAHEKYFRGKPKLDGIVVRYIQSDASRDLAFTNGEVDVQYGRQDARWIRRMRGEKGVTVDVVRPSELYNLHLNVTRPPLDIENVRQAIAHAVDRNQLVNFIGKENSEAAKSIVPIGYQGTLETAKLYPFDQAKAKQLLAEAGFPNGVKVKSIVTKLPQIQSMMEVVQAQLKQSGIDLEMEVVDHPTYHAQIRKDLSDVTVYGAARFPVADTYLTQFFHSRSIVGTPTAITNFNHCNDADAEIERARVEQDKAKQAEAWAQAQAKLIAKVCAVPLVELQQVWARTDRVDYGYPFEAAIHLGPVITEATTRK